MTKLHATHIGSVTFFKNRETGEWKMQRSQDHVSTYEGLTQAELEQASHDLANASKVARYAGHATGCTLDRVTGAVCMVGAIEMATYKEIYTNDVGEFYDLTTEEWVEQSTDRADAAILVLAYILPSNLCTECPVDKHGTETYPFAKISHFGDVHCSGSQQSARLLDLASDVADYRSTHVGGRVQVALPDQRGVDQSMSVA